MKFKDKKVLVFGSGISGVSAAALLLEEGAEVVLYDGNDRLDAAGIKEQIEGQAKGSVRVVLGAFPEALLSELSLVVMSPGVPTDLPSVNQMRDAGIPIWGEIELAYVLGKGDVLAITGTNGKTTTTALLGAIMKNFRESTFVVGNIGNPYTSVVRETKDDSVIVAEMSSFQLETIHTFCPKVSAILNITPDHLNRHHTMECYIKTKERIAENQTEDEVCVLNYEDEVLRAFGETLHTNVLYFSSRQKLDRGLYLDGEDIYYADGENTTKVINVNELNILGTHNYENVMAAAAICHRMGVPLEKIARVAKEFRPVEHRIEFVRERCGVKYYNDSKGTNPDAAIQALRAMPGPTLLIAGGYDKDSAYDEWVKEFEGKVRYLILIGQTRDKIAACAKEHGFTEIMYAEDLAEAVQVSAVYADAGDYVLLSPACASWGNGQRRFLWRYSPMWRAPFLCAYAPMP